MSITGYQKLSEYCLQYSYDVKGIITIAKTYSVAIIKIGNEKFINTDDTNKAMVKYVQDYEEKIKLKIEKSKQSAKLYNEWKSKKETI